MRTEQHESDQQGEQSKGSGRSVARAREVQM